MFEAHDHDESSTIATLNSPIPLVVLTAIVISRLELLHVSRDYFLV